MVAVPVVDRQLVQVGAIELAAALGADRTMDLQRFRAVVAVAVHLVPHPLDKGFRLFWGGEWDSAWAT
ncbi:MAG: hypothetical protein A2X83_12385 [Desulfuromonadales bacterium GWD2_54_10]|nr:MAG: hypothetical protein A2X83_12385 [Desulfuromonadales bacterium GWD2_54_10]